MAKMVEVEENVQPKKESNMWRKRRTKWDTLSTLNHTFILNDKK
jgi:hypothetical protein